MRNTILVVEDNPITQKMVRATLEGEGYRVIAVFDGRSAIESLERDRPDLILQDLVLLDIDGLDLIRELRALPAGAEIPILAYSGLLSKMEQARTLQSGFTDYLFKPVEPSRLLEAVRKYLPQSHPASSAASSGRRILAVNDYGPHLRLWRAQLQAAGFTVTTSPDGGDAFNKALESPPDAIVSDVLMPRMDGFRLCLSVRQHPRLHDVPVVLVSAVYTEEEDQRLAKDVGANALLTCEPDSAEIINSLSQAFGSPTPPVAIRASLTGGYVHRVIRQLERQAALNVNFAQRLALREAELGMLEGIAESLRNGIPAEKMLNELLYRALDAAGVSRGAVYLLDEEGSLEMRVQVGFGADEKGWAGLSAINPDQIREIITAGKPHRCGEGPASGIVVPLGTAGHWLGAFFVQASQRDSEKGWLDLTKVLAAQVGQALAVTRTLLAASRERLARVVETIGDGILVVNRDLRITLANPEAAAILGVPEGALIGSALDPQWPFVHSLKKGEPLRLYDFAFSHASGRHVTLSVNANPLRGDRGAITGAVVSLRDITERKRGEDALRESEERFRALATACSQIVWTTDAAGDSFESGTFLQLTGFDPQTPPGWTEAIHPEDRKTAADAWKQAIESKGPYEGEYRMHMRDGSYRYFAMHGVPMFDQDGTLWQWVGTCADIHERKQAELARAQAEERLQVSQKLEALGTLAGGIAHDFNNLLLAVGGHAALVEADLPPEHPARESLAEVQRATERGCDLVRRILAFSRPQETQRRLVKPECAVDEALQLVKATLPARVKIRTQFAPRLPEISADATQVHQVIMNLVVNASQAMGDCAGDLGVRLETITAGETPGNPPELAKGLYVRLSVSDTGCGIEPAVLPRIFEPFFTTKPAGKGTGLGLSAVHSIVKSHGGAVDVDSRPGSGATFHVYFPAAQQSAVQAEPPPRREARGNGESILYADDDQSLVLLMTRALKRQGYRVAGFTNPGEALEAFRKQPGEFDVIVTDLSMPAMSGIDLARHCRQVRPDIPIVLISGYVRPEDNEAAQSIGVRHIVLKSNSVSELGEVVQSELMQAGRLRPAPAPA